MDNEMHEFEISIKGLDGARVIGDTIYTLDAGEVRSINLRVRLDPSLLDRPSTPIVFSAQASEQASLHRI